MFRKSNDEKRLKNDRTVLNTERTTVKHDNSNKTKKLVDFLLGKGKPTANTGGKLVRLKAKTCARLLEN